MSFWCEECLGMHDFVLDGLVVTNSFVCYFVGH